MKIDLYYYQYNPRLRLWHTTDTEIIPQVGDELYIPFEWFNEVGKKYELQRKMKFGFRMIVVGRSLNYSIHALFKSQNPSISIELKLKEDE